MKGQYIIIFFSEKRAKIKKNAHVAHVKRKKEKKRKENIKGQGPSMRDIGCQNDCS